MSLELHEGKTRIIHTYLSVDNQRPGFKFLGFWIRNYSVGKTKRGKEVRNTRLLLDLILKTFLMFY